MDGKLLSVLVGVASGAAGYWISTFWMKPILQYKELRGRVFADSIFYAQVVNVQGLNERMQKLYEERVFANRRSSADLAACIIDLPAWYKWWLRRRGHALKRAASHLIGYSNTSDYEQAAKVMRAIKKSLGYNIEPDE